LNWLSYAPRVYLSAKTGQGVGRLLSSIQEAYASYVTRVSTAELNRIFAEALERHQPAPYRGHPIRIHYAAQVDVAPPTFVLHTNFPEGLHFSYERYLHNRLREIYGFRGTPIKIVFRKRGEGAPKPRRRGGEGEEPEESQEDGQ